MRTSMLPYARQAIDAADVNAVVEALESDWLTTGPRVDAFEAAIAREAGTSHAVAVSSGTAALHAAAFALNISAGDEVIVPALTFVATANCVVYQGGHPVIVDVDSETLLLDPRSVSAAITPRTGACAARRARPTSRLWLRWHQQQLRLPSAQRPLATSAA